MRTMWIHPGMGKTGTTSIQEAGFRCLKPDAPVRYFPKTWDRVAGHIELIPRHPRYDKAALTNGLKEIANDTRDCFLSSELIHLDGPLIENILTEIERGFDGDIRAIITLRTPGDWYPSVFAQKVKTGQYVVGQSFDEFVDTTGYPGFAMADLWEAHIGKRVDIVQYQNQQWLEKFYSVMGLSRHHFKNLDVFENRSHSDGQLKHLQECDMMHGNLGEKASKIRHPRDVEALLAEVSTADEKLQVSASTREKLEALDQRFEQELERYR